MVEELRFGAYYEFTPPHHTLAWDGPTTQKARMVGRFAFKKARCVGVGSTLYTMAGHPVVGGRELPNKLYFFIGRNLTLLRRKVEKLGAAEPISFLRPLKK